MTIRPREDGPLKDFHEPTPEAEAPGDRDSAVIAATLRIGVSLDLDTVLREAVDGARALTGAPPPSFPARKKAPTGVSR